ncbi:MAG: OmpH family outer membrane protein [Abditibacteriota bacterium]|nr:OmpH family outer membrane protein [Abditibacteriota bacterium]
MKKLLLVLTIILVTGGVFAQQIAYIDTSVIMKSEYITKSYSELETQNNIFQKEIQIRQDNLFLGENEITDLINLAQNNGDQAKITEYQTTNNKRYEELNLLNQTKDLTEEQKNRLTELNNLRKKSNENLQSRAETLGEQMQSLMSKKGSEIEAAIMSACEKIAKEKNYSIVVNKDAIFYGGIDITKDVIAALPKE